MPQIALAAAGAALTTAASAGIAAGTFGAFATALTSTTALFAAAAGAASAALRTVLAPSIKRGVTGSTRTVRQATAFRSVIYGRRRVPGIFAYLATQEDNRGVLHAVIVWAGHEVSEIDEIYMGNRKLWDSADGRKEGHGDFEERVTVVNRLGTKDQSAVQELVDEVAEWTPAHRLLGVAYTYIRLSYRATLFPQGLTNITAQIKGREVYDPRDGSTGFSENPALCLRDYLLNDEFGVGLPAASVPDTYVNALANIADEEITGLPGTDSRYRISASFDEGARARDVIETFLLSMNATGVWMGGQFIMTGGAYSSPDLDLDENDITGPIQVTTRESVRDRYNRVTGVHLREGDGPVSHGAVEYLPLSSDAFREQDNGEELTLNYDLPWTPTAMIARRIARVQLLRSRQEVSVSATFGLRAASAIIKGGLRLSVERYGWTNKEFEVVSWEFTVGQTGAPGVVLQLRETSSVVWDWDADDDAEDFISDPANLPDAFQVDPPQITLSDEIVFDRQEAITILIATARTDDETTTRFELEARKSGDTAWRPMAGSGATVQGGRFELANVADQEAYEVRGRAFNAIGVASDYVIVSRTVVGKSTRPANVTGLRIEVLGDSALLSWKPVADLDLSHYEVRHTPRTSSPAYSGATVLAQRVARPATSVLVPAMTGTYLVKAVDKIGRVSLTAGERRLPVTQRGSDNLVHYSEETAPFGGAFDDTEEVDDEIRLVRADTGERVDDLADFDALDTLIDNYGSGVVATDGTYTISGAVDLGAVYTARLAGRVEFDRLEFGATIDEIADKIDSLDGDWDDIGTATSEGDVSVDYEIRTTDDDPSGSPTWSEWEPFAVGEYTARAFQRRVRAETAFDFATPSISLMTFGITMEDRVERQAGVSASAGVNSITFDAEFYQAPVIQITPLALPTGGTYEISSVSVSGFSVVFRNSSGTAITADFNWAAYGFGKRE